MGSFDTPLVSVIIPTYNRMKYLPECLDSVLSQTYPAIEVIVVDDASTDETATFMNRLVEQDHRIRYIRLPENSGLPAVPRNVGIHDAKGELLAFIDSDDTWHRQKLERQVHALARRPEVGLVHAHLWDSGSKSFVQGLLYLPNPWRRRGGYQVLLTRNLIQCSSVMVRTGLIKELRGFSELSQLRAVEDYHLWLRVSQVANVGYISEVLGRYRWHADGTSALEDMEARRKSLDIICGSNLVRSPTPVFVRFLRKMAGLPIAVVFHLILGPLLHITRLPPFVLVTKTDSS